MAHRFPVNVEKEEEGVARALHSLADISASCGINLNHVHLAPALALLRSGR
jgi:hypothetical protein